MSAYKEKMIAEKRIKEIDEMIAQLLNDKEAYQRMLEDAMQDIKWEAQNDR